MTALGARNVSPGGFRPTPCTRKFALPAASARLPLYRYLGGTAANELPVPMVNIMSGGIHGGGNVDFQDFMMIPLRAETYTRALSDVNAVYRAVKDVLKERNVYRAGVADDRVR